MPLSFWTALDVVKTLLVCIISIIGGISRFIILTKEQRDRSGGYDENKSKKKTQIWILEYLILLLFVVSVIIFEILYNILMVFTQLSSQ